MNLTDIDINAITEDDLKAAIAEGLKPGLKIAFAPAAYEHPFVKEISSLANSRGGLMLLGIAEKDGIATGFAPLTGNADDELRQLATRVQTGITPPIPGVLVKAIKLADGGIVVAFHVPASQRLPHRVGDPRDARGTLVYRRDGQGLAFKLHPRAVDEMFG
jgi:predicted HTH transcriptional regulator